MKIRLSQKTLQVVKEVAELKSISKEQATILILDLYSSRYLMMISHAKIAASRAKAKYD